MTTDTDITFIEGHVPRDSLVYPARVVVTVSDDGVRVIKKFDVVLQSVVDASGFGRLRASDGCSVSEQAFHVHVAFSFCHIARAALQNVNGGPCKYELSCNPQIVLLCG